MKHQKLPVAQREVLGASCPKILPLVLYCFKPFVQSITFANKTHIPMSVRTHICLGHLNLMFLQKGVTVNTHQKQHWAVF